MKKVWYLFVLLFAFQTGIAQQPKTTDSISNLIAQSPEYTKKSFYDNGIIKQKTFYQNGLIVTDSLFYETGSLKMAKKFEDGQLVHLEAYYSNHILEKEENFQNNQKHGVQKYINQNGKPLKIENYKLGKKHGEQKIFDAESNLLAIKQYNNGQLVKLERYTEDGKKVVTILDGITETKVINQNGIITNIKYQDIKTKQPDSLWITYDPVTGEKLTEKAYKNGKLIRSGQYVHNKKNGEWITYWQNGNIETHKFYDKGKLLKTYTVTYNKQIKNNYKDGDVIWQYTTYLPKAEHKLVLVRFDSVQTTSQKYVQKRILKILKFQGLKPIKNVDSLKERELFASMHFSKIKVKLKSKQNDNKNFVTFISFDLDYQDFENDKNLKKSFTFSPATRLKPKYRSHYVRDKKRAFFKTLNRLTEKMYHFISKKFPLTGVIRKKTGNTSRIREVFVNLGTQQLIKKGDYFDVLSDDGIIKARLKVKSVLEKTSIAEVEEGGKWLVQYLQNTALPKVVKSNKKVSDDDY